MNLSIEQLRVTVAVARASSFSDAARQLSLTQPAVTRSVRAVERSVRARLFTRTTRRVELTADGQEFVAVAQGILDSYDDGLKRFAAYQRAESGSLTVVALPVLAGGILPPIVAEFLAGRPNVQLRLITGTASRIQDRLYRGDAHLAITEVPDRHDGLRLTLLDDDPMLAAVPREHPLAASDFVTWAQLAEFPFVEFEEGTSVRRLADEGFARAGVQPRSAVTADATSTAIALVKQGLGVTAFPETTLPIVAQAGLRFFPLQGPAVSRRLAVMTPEAPSPSILTREFIAAVLAARGRQRDRVLEAKAS